MANTGLFFSTGFLSTTVRRRYSCPIVPTMTVRSFVQNPQFLWDLQHQSFITIPSIFAVGYQANNRATIFERCFACVAPLDSTGANRLTVSDDLKCTWEGFFDPRRSRVLRVLIGDYYRTSNQRLRNLQAFSSYNRSPNLHVHGTASGFSYS